MTKEISIEQFRNAIKKLPSDKLRVQPGVWYKTQKEHWLGWLKEYRGPGAYRRKGGENREPKFAYNHIIEHKMLLWIIDAAGVDPKLVRKAKSVIDDNETLQANAAAIRQVVSWEKLADALFDNRE